MLRRAPRAIVALPTALGMGDAATRAKRSTLGLKGQKLVEMLFPNVPSAASMGITNSVAALPTALGEGSAATWVKERVTLGLKD